MLLKLNLFVDKIKHNSVTVCSSEILKLCETETVLNSPNAFLFNTKFLWPLCFFTLKVKLSSFALMSRTDFLTGTKAISWNTEEFIESAFVLFLSAKILGVKYFQPHKF